MEPAKSIVTALGGPKHVSDSLQSLSPGAVVKWYAPIAKGGCGGLIPSRHIPSLIGIAHKQSKELAPADFFRGHLPE